MRLREITHPLGQLDPYEGIAWDFDNTLINNPNSPLFYRYILDNPEKRHVIVTFRTHGMQRRMFSELSQIKGAPSETDFQGYLNVSDDLWSAWNMAEIKRDRGLLSGPLTDEEIAYKEWKGRTCREHNLLILVDDDLVNTRPGCLNYGITLMDSFSLKVV